MATIAKLTPGQTLYELRRQKMGNTAVRRTACYEVRVIEVAGDGSHIIASWNGNAPRRYRESDVKKLRVKKPEPKRQVLGMPSYA